MCVCGVVVCVVVYLMCVYVCVCVCVYVCRGFSVCVEVFSVSITMKEGGNEREGRSRRGIALRRILGQDGGLRQERTRNWQSQSPLSSPTVLTLTS